MPLVRRRRFSPVLEHGVEKWNHRWIVRPVDGPPAVSVNRMLVNELTTHDKTN
jgi:hypothetical protein